MMANADSYDLQMRDVPSKEPSLSYPTSQQQSNLSMADSVHESSSHPSGGGAQKQSKGRWT